MSALRRVVFDGRTLGDHYPGIGRYAFGLWQALGNRVGLTLIDPHLANSRFQVTGSTLAVPSVRSLAAQWVVPQQLHPSDLFYSPYWLMPYRLPCASVVTLYDATPLVGSEMSAFNKIVFRLCHWLAGRVAQRIIVLSDSARAEMVALGIPPDKIQICPPGLDPSFRPAEPDDLQRIKQKYDLPDRFSLCFGSKRWHKNTAAAIAAARSQTLIVIGQSSINSTVGAGLRPAPTIPYVPENDLPALYSAAHCLIFPSLREGFGLPIIEAMACGTPVVCLPAPGVREAAGGAAMMATDMTTAALTEAVRLLDDETIWHAKRAAGLQWVKQFTWEQTIRVLLAHENPSGL